MNRLGIVGGGAWGTALATVAARNGPVRLWALEPEVVRSINEDHCNSLYLAGVRLAPEIEATSDLERLSTCDALIIVTPAQHLRSALVSAPSCDGPLILCAKGIESGTHLLMSEVAAEVCPAAPVVVLSGPTFAHEVAAGLPTAVTLASAQPAVADAFARRIALPTFRPYLTDDVVGAEIGGSVKNVLAIACGIVEGKGLGQNARAALIARGYAEMLRFGKARGARPETLSGLSGLGDLVLTCSSTSSRNFSLGLGLGQGRSAREMLADRRTVAEGASTAPVLREAAKQAQVDMPIVDAVCRLLDGSSELDAILKELLARPLKNESRER